jgi:hypothetical protein
MCEREREKGVIVGGGAPDVLVPVEVEKICTHDVELRIELAERPHNMIEEHEVEVFGKLGGEEVSHFLQVSGLDDHGEVAHTSHWLRQS